MKKRRTTSVLRTRQDSPVEAKCSLLSAEPDSSVEEQLQLQRRRSQVRILVGHKRLALANASLSWLVFSYEAGKYLRKKEARKYLRKKEARKYL